MSGKLLVAYLDDDEFYLEMIRELMEKSDFQVDIFSHPDDLAQLSPEALSKYHGMILDYDLGGKTILEIGMPSFLKKNKLFSGKLILLSLLEEFGSEQSQVDLWFDEVLNKEKVDRKSLEAALK